MTNEIIVDDYAVLEQRLLTIKTVYNGISSMILI